MPGSIASGSRAVETVHDYGDLRMPVRLEDAAGDPVSMSALREAIEATSILRATSAEEAASACVYLLPGGKKAGEGPVPQLASNAEPSWVVVGEDGRVIAPQKRVRDHAEVVENLVTIARYRQALMLDNPDAASAIRGKVGLELLRKGPDGSWIAAQPDAGGNIIYEEDDAIAWRVTNRHSMPLHVNLLDFGLGRGIVRLFPERGATDKVDANFTFDIGTRVSDPEFTLGFPDTYPYAETGADEVTEGCEAFKLVLTTHEADFSFLEQTGVRTATTVPDSAVMMLMRTAMGATTTREARKKVSLDVEDWGTVTRTITLRRKRAH
jgi:hypothetical protein